MKESSGKPGLSFLPGTGVKILVIIEMPPGAGAELAVGDEGAYLLPHFSLLPSGGEMFCETLDKKAGR
jgi:hypothetical protein